jgi:hypothetical protein
MGEACIGCFVKVRGQVTGLTPIMSTDGVSVGVIEEGGYTGAGFDAFCRASDVSGIAVGQCVVLNGTIQKRVGLSLSRDPDWLELDPCKVESCPK